MIQRMVVNCTLLRFQWLWNRNFGRWRNLQSTRGDDDQTEKMPENMPVMLKLDNVIFLGTKRYGEPYLKAHLQRTKASLAILSLLFIALMLISFSENAAKNGFEKEPGSTQSKSREVRVHSPASVIQKPSTRFVSSAQ